MAVVERAVEKTVWGAVETATVAAAATVAANPVAVRLKRSHLPTRSSGSSHSLVCHCHIHGDQPGSPDDSTLQKYHSSHCKGPLHCKSPSKGCLHSAAGERRMALARVPP